MRTLLYQVVIALVFFSCATTKTTSRLDESKEDQQTQVPPTTETQDESALLDRSKPPEPGPAPEIKLGTAETFTMDNGLKVFVVENHKLPRVAFSLVLDLDPMFEGENAGYISTAGQLLSRGTTSRTKSQLDEEIDFIGASLSTSASGVYASSLSKHREKILELMADVLLRPSFPEEELEKIKTETISGIQASKDDPGAIAGNVSRALLYGKDHPYGELVTEETVSRIDIESCKQYYETYFKPNIGYLAIVGDVDKQEAQRLVEKYFGDWKAGEVPKHQYDLPTAPQQTAVALVDRPQSVQSKLSITYPVELKTGDPDVLKCRVMNTILGVGSSSYLFLNLREDKGYTYGAYSSLSSDRLIGSFSAGADVRNEVTDSAVVEFMKELKRIREQPVEAERLQATKNYINGSFARTLESPSTVARFAINTDRYQLPDDYYSNYLKRLEAVSTQDVQEMAQKYIRPENAHILVVGKAADIAEDLEQFGPVQYYDIYGEPYTPTSAEDLAGEIDVQQIIDNYLQALGGRDKLEEIKDITQVMKASMQGLDLQITSIRKAPNMSFESVTAGEMELQKMLFNGTSGVEVVQGQSKPLDEKKIQESMVESRIVPEISYEDLGVELTLTGLEKVGEEDTYAVEIKQPSGKTSYAYFSKESGLKLKESTTMETPQGSFTQSVEYQDYQEIDGIKFPHKAKIGMGPQVMEAEVVNIELNTGVSDDLFKVE